ncbi:MAG: hypothetical protein Unbinned2716contig1001_38 [Prokaryotic dsDNA virus sp.]|nr:MAG: hypothetical protein Unbinned2716contig1001_38 [Prokaryotic dsDNA virus sp.]
MKHTIDFLIQRISRLEATMKLKDEKIASLEAQLENKRNINPNKENYGR